MKPIGRNETCYCGSGKKYKKCCLQKDELQKKNSMASHGNVIQFPGSTRPPESQYSLDQMMETINDMLIWKSEAYKEVAEIFVSRLHRNYSLHHGEARQMVFNLTTNWHQFSSEIEPKFRKSGGFAGALEYMAAINLSADATQKELATQHAVSEGTLSRCFAQLFDYMGDNGLLPGDSPITNSSGSRQAGFSLKEGEEQMRAITELLNAQNFQSSAEAQAFLDKLMRDGVPESIHNEASKAQQARELLITADREPNSRKRIELAEQAMKLDPGNADIYLIYSQEANTVREALHYAKLGMEAAKTSLGADFFKKNTGHFWGLIETRPFMRAKFAYAQLLQEDDNDKDAASQYEELLTLCPNDNLGARYELLAIYLNQNELKLAQQLFDEHEEHTTNVLYDQLVLEYLKNGISDRLAPLASAARKANPYVIAYVTGQKKLSRLQNDYITVGDESEAENYAYRHRKLWIKPELAKLRSWLNQQQ
ncbi:SEC-C motif-containing protein [Paenibacillaceae bacterium GAS479]|nr:SEC-C motif-containing protein [Paenibacillaceae bacterium GAS479]